MLSDLLVRIEPDGLRFGQRPGPFCETIGGILFLNPGSVTRPRGGTQPSMVRMTIDNGKITPEFMEF